MSAKPRKIALIGSPNVGKSAMFVQLTGTHANVSDYPGTTVEIARGRTLIADETFEVTDTPGMHSLIPVSEEERVARNLFLSFSSHFWLVLVSIFYCKEQGCHDEVYLMQFSL